MTPPPPRAHPFFSLLLLALVPLSACDSAEREVTITPLGTGAAAPVPNPETPTGTGTTTPSATSPAGTGQGATPSTGRESLTLMMWHSYRGDEETAIDQVVALFNRTHPDTVLETLSVPFDAYPDRISAAIPRGRGPDLFIFAHDRVGDWADQGIIEPVNFWSDGPLLDQFFDITVQALVYNRSLYGLPLAFKSVVLFYNTALVQTPPATTDELVTVATGLTDSAAGTFGLVYQYDLCYFHAGWLHGFGGRVIDDQGNLAFNTPEAAASVAFVQSLYRDHHLMPENAYSQTAVTLFNTARAGMVISGPWFWSEIADGVQWAVAPLPIVTATGRPAQPFLSSEAAMLSAHGQHKDRAFEVARWLATDPEAVRIRMQVGHQPVALQSAYTDLSQVDPTIQVFHRQMLESVPMPNVPLMRRVWGHFDTALFNAIKNGADPTLVMQTAYERVLAE